MRIKKVNTSRSTSSIKKSFLKLLSKLNVKLDNLVSCTCDFSIG